MDLSSEGHTSRELSGLTSLLFSPIIETDIENSSSYHKNHIYLNRNDYRRSRSFDTYNDMDGNLRVTDSSNYTSSDENENDDESIWYGDQTKDDEQINNYEKCNSDNHNNQNVHNYQNIKLSTKVKQHLDCDKSNVNAQSSINCQLINLSSNSKNYYSSRIPITFSVRSMLQHVNIVSSESNRSLSCNNTPLKNVWDNKYKPQST